jgi:hypothetical protein
MYGMTGYISCIHLPLFLTIENNCMWKPVTYCSFLLNITLFSFVLFLQPQGGCRVCLRPAGSEEEVGGHSRQSLPLPATLLLPALGDIFDVEVSSP